MKQFVLCYWFLLFFALDQAPMSMVSNAIVKSSGISHLAVCQLIFQA